MKRIMFGALLVSIALMVFAGDLWAHGGQYRGPGGAVPPEPARAQRPDAPGAAPALGPPHHAASDHASPVPAPQPDHAAPTPAPGTPRPTTPRRWASKTKGAQGTLGFENWVFWYHNNKADIENLKKALYTPRRLGEPALPDRRPQPVQPLGRDARHPCQGRVATSFPTLLWAMDPKNACHQDTQSAAYIALAKMAKEPPADRAHQEGPRSLAQARLIVQESAAIALGLLRRGDKAKQFDAGELDKVREFLFGDLRERRVPGSRTRGFAALADRPPGRPALRLRAPTAGTRPRPSASSTLLGARRLQPPRPRDRRCSMAIGLQPPPSVTEDAA